MRPLRKFRKDRNWTLRDLADQVGVTEGQMSRIEREGTTSLDMALKLSNVTGLPPQHFKRELAA